MEPRTATAQQRLKVIESLSNEGIPVGIMCAPIIPGLTDHEVPKVLKSAAVVGARWAGYTIVRLNGEISKIFEDWLWQSYPERANRIWHSIQACHNGKVNDSEFGNRMRGTGQIAEIIRDNFRLHCRKNGLNNTMFNYDLSHFRNQRNNQLNLFDF